MNKLSNKKRSGHIIGCTDWFQIKLSITRALTENGHYSGWLRPTSLFHVITSYFIIPGDYVILHYFKWLRHALLFQVITSYLHTTCCRESFASDGTGVNMALSKCCKSRAFYKYQRGINVWKYWNIMTSKTVYKMYNDSKGGKSPL